MKRATITSLQRQSDQISPRASSILFISGPVEPVPTIAWVSLAAQPAPIKGEPKLPVPTIIGTPKVFSMS